MYLKSLTLKGFKSFADSTVIDLEPGVTVVVGPNGSGKSNIVDAVSWVLGAQGPRTVRSSKMEDVIFAGTESKSSLGRAEVSLTIDNSLKRLPIDFSEVTLTRTLFRNGESDYAINSTPCRLLDIQELLSDSGVGKSQHVIVSQGQIDSILSARPEDRRIVIEEAAGILKYRRRREKAERRLLATQTNLDRLTDLYKEVKRQISPLERQAQAAKMHKEYMSELHALKLFVVGRDVEALSLRKSSIATDLESLRSKEIHLLDLLDELSRKGEYLESKISKGIEDNSTELLSKYQSLKARANGIRNVIVERRRFTANQLNQILDEEVINTLEADVINLNKELESLDDRLAKLKIREDSAQASQISIHRQKDELDKKANELASAKESFTKLANKTAERNSLHVLLERESKNSEGLKIRISQLSERQNTVSQESASLPEMKIKLEDRLSQRETEREAIVADLEQTKLDVMKIRDTKRDLETKVMDLRTSLNAMNETYRLIVGESGYEYVKDLTDLNGVLADFVDVQPEFQIAFTSVIKRALGAAIFSDIDSLIAAFKKARSLKFGAILLDGFSKNYFESDLVLTSGFTLLKDHVSSRKPEVDTVVNRITGNVIVALRVEDEDEESYLQRAARFEISNPSVTVVTLDGDCFSRDGFELRKISKDVGIETITKSAFDQTNKDLENFELSLDSTKEAQEELDRKYDTLVGQLTKFDIEMSGERHRLSQIIKDIDLYEKTIDEYTSEINKLSMEVSEINNRTSEYMVALSLIEDELETLVKESSTFDEIKREYDSQLQKYNNAFERNSSEVAEINRLHAGIAERKSYVVDRLKEIELRLVGRDEKREQAKQKLELLEVTAQGLAGMQSILDSLIREIDSDITVSNLSVTAAKDVLNTATKDLEKLRSERKDAEEELLKVREKIQHYEIELAEIAVRREHLYEMLEEELGEDLNTAANVQCPPLPPGVSPEDRISRLEREIRLIGPVNALAADELAGLQERQMFLNEQLDDVKNARKELHGIIRTIDDEISFGFESAFNDVSVHFKKLIEVLFPGGSGSLVLSDPDHSLESGIEIEASPKGKTVKKLSLLSGGERTLVAMAFLFAVFRSRPSPFYVLDEVEAALDDLNLTRFLGLINEFRSSAQLIIVSHQKRTMESADALYGVSMQAGGASKVVSEKLNPNKEPEVVQS